MICCCILTDYFFRAHRLNVTIALNLTKYLVNDTEYIPWESALKNLDHLVLMFDRSEVYGPITVSIRTQFLEYVQYSENCDTQH